MIKLIPTIELIQRAIQDKTLQNLEFPPNLYLMVSEILDLDYSLESNQVSFVKFLQNLSLMSIKK